VRVDHLAAPAIDYARSTEAARVIELVGTPNMATFADAHGTREVWRSWQATAPWCR
jgi:hypothetical protein